MMMWYPDVLECGVPMETDKPREMQASTVEARHLLIRESAFEAQTHSVFAPEAVGALCGSPFSSDAACRVALLSHDLEYHVLVYES